jgi:hypothetical protein
MTTTASTNGNVRKSLAEQIDRLDSMLDGLAENLNEAVAAAVKEAVGLAVREAIQGIVTEVLSHPELVARLLGNVMPATATGQEARTPTARRPVTTRVRTSARRACGWIATQLRSAVASISQFPSTLSHGLTTSWARLQFLRRFKLQLLLAVAVGSAAGVAAYFAGPWLAVAASAVGGFATTLAVHTGLWLRKMLGTAVAMQA